ncbi:MAG TPA: hypothetical protein ENK18_00710 [Deltaproteobacteria bacterium]|nr:hypothetical protein [Deltaproteobacteria bacterium]
MSVIGLEVGPFEIVAPVALPGPETWCLATRSGSGGDGLVLVALLPSGADEQAHAGLRRQHQVLSALDDPRIPSVIALYEDRLALVITHAGGAPLSGVVLGRRRGEILMTPATLLDLMFEATEALQQVHQHRWFHGHLSPDHVWLTPEGGAWLLGLGQDPGLELPERWRAPEQVRGQPLGPWTDQWGLASLATSLVSGCPPWGDPDPLQQARVGDPGPAVETVSQQWPALARVLRRMLDPDPQGRFPDLHAVRHQLLTLAKQTRSTSERRDLGAWLSGRAPVWASSLAGAQRLDQIDSESSLTLLDHSSILLGPAGDVQATTRPEPATDTPQPVPADTPVRPGGLPEVPPPSEEPTVLRMGPPEAQADIERTVLFVDQPSPAPDPDLELTELALDETSRVTTASELQAALALAAAREPRSSLSGAPTEPMAPPRAASAGPTSPLDITAADAADAADAANADAAADAAAEPVGSMGSMGSAMVRALILIGILIGAVLLIAGILIASL